MQAPLDNEVTPQVAPLRDAALGAPFSLSTRTEEAAHITRIEKLLARCQRLNKRQAMKQIIRMRKLDAAKRRIGARDMKKWQRAIEDGEYENLSAMLEELVDAHGKVLNTRAMKHAASSLAIDATKQNIFEKAHLNYLRRNIVATQAPHQLPAYGAAAHYLVPGSTEKSLDFCWRLDTDEHRLVALVSHKYTREDGGNQKHQRNEIAHLIEKCANDPTGVAKHLRHLCDATRVLVMGIVDGPFYQTEAGQNWLNEMRRRCDRIPGRPIWVGSSVEAVKMWPEWTANEMG